MRSLSTNPTPLHRRMRPVSAVAAAALLFGALAASTPGLAETAPFEAVPFQAGPAEEQAAEAPDQEAPEEAEASVIGTGIASWYGKEFSGRRTASGERFDPGALTAAHRSLPFGSKVRVTHTRTGESVVVRINDRGPFSHGRLIDLSQAAAAQLGIVRAGMGEVSLALLSE